jgi:hypothetical protein
MPMQMMLGWAGAWGGGSSGWGWPMVDAASLWVNIGSQWRGPCEGVGGAVWVRHELPWPAVTAFLNCNWV